MSVCLVRGVNIITILYVLEVINIQRELNCIRRDNEDMVKVISRKTDENFTQGFKNNNTNLEVPASG